VRLVTELFAAMVLCRQMVVTFSQWRIQKFWKGRQCASTVSISCRCTLSTI